MKPVFCLAEYYENVTPQKKVYELHKRYLVLFYRLNKDFALSVQPVNRSDIYETKFFFELLYFNCFCRRVLAVARYSD